MIRPTLTSDQLRFQDRITAAVHDGFLLREVLKTVRTWCQIESRLSGELVLRALEGLCESD
jgi:hypothetical protein